MVVHVMGLTHEMVIWYIRFLYKCFTSVPNGGKRRGGEGRLNKACGVSPELQLLVSRHCQEPRWFFFQTNLDPLYPMLDFFPPLK